MKLDSLRLVNFRQHADTHIAFGDGLTSIIGANGSGKTTILEAIAWALYGNAAARGTRESIRFSRAPAGASVRVELEFALAGHRYRVVRKLTSAELYLDGATQPIAATITGVTDLLERRLGMTRQEFFNTYFTGQKQLNAMAAMGPAERGQFLSRVLGYERLRVAQQLVRDRRRSIVAEVQGLRSGMPNEDTVAALVAATEARQRAAIERVAETARVRADAVATLAQIAPRWAAAQSARELAQRLDSDLRIVEGEAIALRRDSDRLARELAEIAESRAALDALRAELAPMPSVDAELRRQEELARAEGRRLALSDAERTLLEELERQRQRREQLATAPEVERESATALERVRAEYDAAQIAFDARRSEWDRDRQEAETKRDALRDRYEELRGQRERLMELGENSPCPTCTRPLGASYKGVIELLDEQLDAVQVDGRFYRDRMEQLREPPDEVKALEERRRTAQTELARLERRAARAQAASQQLEQLAREIAEREERARALRAELLALPAGYDAARHAHLRAELDRLATLDARAARLSGAVEREPATRRELARVSTALAAADERYAELRDARDAMAFDDAAFHALRISHEQSAAAAHRADLATVAAESESRAAKEAREEAERQLRELARLQETLAGLQRDKRLHDELDRAYSDLRTELNVTLRPELSEIASGFLGDLTDGRYSEIELDDQYNVIVLEDGVPKPVISGGEEDLANLVLRLSISQMIAERAGQAFSLLVLDEVFGSLDEHRRHNVVELLRKLQDRFEQVILITHIEGVRDGVDHVIGVRYDEERGSSVVTQLEPGDRSGASYDAGAAA